MAIFIRQAHILTMEGEQSQGILSFQVQLTLNTPLSMVIFNGIPLKLY